MNAVLQAQKSLSLRMQSEEKGWAATVMKLAVGSAPSVSSALHKFRLLQCAARAVMDGICVFLLTCMLFGSVHM